MQVPRILERYGMEGCIVVKKEIEYDVVSRRYIARVQIGEEWRVCSFANEDEANRWIDVQYDLILSKFSIA